jgi:pimeloyl-ACP methyl ester carboxylesterase
MAARLDQTALKRLEELRQAGLNESDPKAYCREWNKAYRPSQLARPESLASMRSDPCAFPNEWEQNLSPRLGHMWAALGDWDWRSQLASLEVPTLVVHGAEDLIPLESSREWAAALPNARLLLIPDAGHMPAIEAPEVFFPAADRFLRGAWPEQAEMVTDTS